ncbi:hypothetical protein JO965_26455 (plasmid) [Microvirga sp. VF16]|nr:hypothetical protein JO965_26455 [Microvirga sp. VF16]
MGIGLANTGENPTFGTPRKPVDPSRLVDGSSSGAAASVAEGSVIAALGTDTGGSIRQPAARYGLAGFKPLEGRISTQGVTPLSTTLDTLVNSHVRLAAARSWMPRLQMSHDRPLLTMSNSPCD